jgi:hypothetical protein
MDSSLKDFIEMVKRARAAEARLGHVYSCRRFERLERDGESC